MNTLETVLLILLIVDSVALGALVLIQQGKGADVGAAFGAGSANTLFGSAGSASFLTKMTVWLAIGFFVISFGLAYTAKQRADTLRGVGLPGVEQSLFDDDGILEDAPATDADEPAESSEQQTGSESDLPDV